MALLAVQHSVRDYSAWQAVYETLGEVECDWGVTTASVHQLAEAPNMVLVLRHFATIAQAQGFLTSLEVQAAMERGGVEGEPRIEIYA